MGISRCLAVLSLLLLQSCAGSRGALRSLPEETSAIDPAIRKMARGSGKVELLDHQLIPIDYMHKHPEQKGLLVNHYMGTGKTYLGIGFAETYPDHPVIVLAPRFLKSHWRNQIKEYGVKDERRYTFVSYEQAVKELSSLDVTKHILLVDEVHNLIKYMRGVDTVANEQYIKVYSNLRKSYKILGLTGTPIYGDESDVAFIINFVSGEDIMPFNQESFRLKYTEVLPTRQFFRGYITESNLMVNVMPISFGLFAQAMLGPIGIVVGFPVGIFTSVLVNALLDPNEFKLRRLDVDKMSPILSKYFSYFKFSEESFKDFPAQEFEVVEVPYNRYQYSFFLRLVEGDLPVAQLQRLLRNEHTRHDDDYVRINSSNIHERFYSTPGAGRDIGNFEFVDLKGKIIEAPKFTRIYEQLLKNDEKTVIYSNFYETGILAFKSFLERMGYGKKFAIITPELSVEEVNQRVKQYNSGEIKLLMLHPEITEGISLIGTQYLHILEPMMNSTVFEQVVGRTRRFKSHSHLPKDKQLVHVRMWQSTSSTWNPDLGQIKRANWYKRYREMNYLSRWGIGISQIDKKMDQKALNPEQLAYLKLKTIEKNFGEMQDVLKHRSIENNYR